MNPAIFNCFSTTYMNSANYYLSGGDYRHSNKKVYKPLTNSQTGNSNCSAASASWMENADVQNFNEYADWVYNFTARYGQSNFGYPNSLKFHADESESTGSGLVDYVEIWNEQDADWWGNNAFTQFTPQEYAAMASSAYDGYYNGTFYKNQKPGVSDYYRGLRFATNYNPSQPESTVSTT
ncbi:MAG: hypothetical protein GY702_19625, partial [Desulfobulbaceae bacterium]|nr:hypothetical protein [Desulfobulbaceae bacterium]